MNKRHTRAFFYAGSGLFALIFLGLTIALMLGAIGYATWIVIQNWNHIGV